MTSAKVWTCTCRYGNSIVSVRQPRCGVCGNMMTEDKR